MTSRPAELPDHPRRLSAARRVAEWKFGEAAIADEIIRAYLDPDASDLAVENEIDLEVREGAEERQSKMRAVDPEIRERALKGLGDEP
jgi:hypothetical protein